MQNDAREIQREVTNAPLIFMSSIPSDNYTCQANIDTIGNYLPNFENLLGPN